MKTKNILTSFVAGTVALTNVSCKREPLHRVTDAVKNPIIERVDSFTKSSLNKIDTTGFELFKVDTVAISNKKLNNPKRLATAIKEKTISENDFVRNRNQYYSGNVLSVSDFTNLWKNGDTVQSEILKDSVICKMQNKVFTNKIENKYFVPIEYYKKK